MVKVDAKARNPERSAVIEQDPAALLRSLKRTLLHAHAALDDATADLVAREQAVAARGQGWPLEQLQLALREDFFIRIARGNVADAERFIRETRERIAALEAAGRDGR